jgi:outer membrane protein insertion porin family
VGGANGMPPGASSRARWTNPFVRALLVLVVLAAAGTAARAQAALTVTEIRFEGNRHYGDPVLKQRIRLRVGQPFDDRLLERDVRTLYEYFLDVRAEKAVTGKGVAIVFRVVESPRVVAIRLIGNEEFDTEDIMEWLRTKRDLPVFKYKLTADCKEITQKYKAKGYHFVEVRSHVLDEAAGNIVVFRITEGPRVDIDEIEFRGNDSLDEDLFNRPPIMVSRESGFLSRGDYIEDVLERDLVAILEFYRSEGFRDVRVQLGALDFSDDNDEVRIRIDIDEGEPYVIDTIEIEGGDTFPSDRSILKGLLTVKVGDRFRIEDAIATREAISIYYKEASYYGAQVQIQDLVYRAEGTGVGLTFSIAEGVPVAIDRLEIEGNERTRDKVIRRQISLVPGGPLNAIELQKSYMNLRDLGYFSKVEVMDPDTEDPSRKDIIFRFEEGRTGDLRFSAGVNSNLGVMGQVTLTKRNFDFRDLPDRLSDVVESRAFTGGGQFLRLNLAPGSTYSTFRINFIEPWLFDRRISGEFDIYRSFLFRRGYRIERTGVRVYVGKRWKFPRERVDDRLSLHAGFRIENPAIAKVDDDEAPDNAVIDEGLHQVRSLLFRAGYTHVDSQSSPGEGWTARVDYELGTPAGNVQFNDVRLRGAHYWTLYTDRQERRHIVSLSGEAGWMEGYGDTDDIPISERFFLGGLGSVRGFAYRTIGPKSNGEPEGGEAMYRGTLEYSFPIYERLLGGSLFLDVGNVTENWRDDDMFRRIRVSPGIGLRISIPMLGPRPIEFSLGWPVKRYQHDDQQVFGFSFGRDF